MAASTGAASLSLDWKGPEQPPRSSAIRTESGKDVKGVPDLAKLLNKSLLIMSNMIALVDRSFHSSIGQSYIGIACTPFYNDSRMETTVYFRLAFASFWPQTAKKMQKYKEGDFQ
ncbi:MAG: hypothetical protein HY717_17470 [Planctomycetes bacterium]|nr:hypothetical protein [Planctomycetota bacterium]